MWHMRWDGKVSHLVLDEYLDLLLVGFVELSGVVVLLILTHVEDLSNGRARWWLIIRI